MGIGGTVAATSSSYDNRTAGGKTVLPTVLSADGHMETSGGGIGRSYGNHRVAGWPLPPAVLQMGRGIAAWRESWSGDHSYGELQPGGNRGLETTPTGNCSREGIVVWRPLLRGIAAWRESWSGDHSYGESQPGGNRGRRPLLHWENELAFFVLRKGHNLHHCVHVQTAVDMGEQSLGTCTFVFYLRFHPVFINYQQ